MKPSTRIKVIEIRRSLLQQSIHPLAVFHIHRHQVLLASVIAMTLISTSQASEELNYVPTWPSRQLLEAIHMQLAMMQIALHAYNASSQLVRSIKSTFVEDPNARKVKRVRMVNLYWINGHGNPRLFIS